MSDATADELARADAGHHFVRGDARPFRGLGLGVPTLAAVLARYRDHRLIVEMKENSPELARAVVEAVRRADAVDRVCLGSFGLRVLRAARASGAGGRDERGARGGALGALSILVPLAGVARCVRGLSGARDVPAARGSSRRVSSSDAHRMDLRVQVWTVDAERDASRLLGWGVDGLITDRPDVMVPLVHFRRRGGSSLES